MSISIYIHMYYIFSNIKSINLYLVLQGILISSDIATRGLVSHISLHCDLFDRILYEVKQQDHLAIVLGREGNSPGITLY